MVDALSKRQEDSTVMSISIAQPTWFQEVAQSYEDDPIALQLLGELIVNPTGLPDYTLHQGIIRFKHKIYVGKGNDLRLKILQTMYQSALGGIRVNRGLTRECNWFSIGLI